jgi:signal transduction histidine kinase
MLLARQKRINIEYDQTSGLELIRVDRGRMVQVFRNLIENAIQHSPPESSINIINRHISVEDAHWIECLIEDQGPGFNPKDLPRIFEPFFTRRRGGTGLGMSIVQRIIEGHGGRISLANRPDGGAAVMIQIPIDE